MLPPASAPAGYCVVSAARVLGVAHMQLRHGSAFGLQDRNGAGALDFEVPLWWYPQGARRGVLGPGFNDTLAGPEYTDGYESEGDDEPIVEENEEDETDAGEGPATDSGSESTGHRSAAPATARRARTAAPLARGGRTTAAAVGMRATIFACALSQQRGAARGCGAGRGGGRGGGGAAAAASDSEDEAGRAGPAKSRRGRGR